MNSIAENPVKEYSFRIKDNKKVIQINNLKFEFEVINFKSKKNKDITVFDWKEYHDTGLLIVNCGKEPPIIRIENLTQQELKIIKINHDVQHELLDFLHSVSQSWR